MPDAESLRFFFDYVDPASFLVEREIARLETEFGSTVERVPFEVRVPPSPMVDTRTSEWGRFWEGAQEAAREKGVTLARPRLVPWTRKAHELALHAREEGRFPAIHTALFEAFMLDGKDLGRVDVLLSVATLNGLDLTRTKAVLDVDRHAATVGAARESAERLGVRGVPTLRTGDRTLEGFQGSGNIRAFLQQASSR